MRTNSQQGDARETLDHAWHYFSIHAGQRISIFNFFLVLSGLVAAGLAGCLVRGGAFQLFGVFLGLSLALVSFIFWKLDQRTSFLVKIAEDTLVEQEQLFSTAAARLFSRERELTGDDKSLGFSLRRMWTYGLAFRVVFWVMGIIGVAGAGLCFIRYRWGF